tara:strand:+ start:550 stop:1455 length:906 start_codon:yes stop_codon:yes gene_type:complete
MNRLTILIIIFFFNCTDLLTENNLYKSVILRGGSWIEFQNSDVISFLDNDFSLQILVSGMVDNTNNAKVLFSVINESDNSLELGLLRNTSVNNAIDIYINGIAQNTIVSDDLNWSTVSFNLITVTSDKSEDGSNTSVIKVFINEQELYISDPTSINFGNANLIIGARVNSSQTYADNFWVGLIDEIRFWNFALPQTEIEFHATNLSKINSSSGCSDPQFLTFTSCQSNGETWTGIYSDERLNNLKGLWRFNYNSPRFNLVDESCVELELDSGLINNNICENINGVLYTLPGYSAQFSRQGM